MIDEGIKILDEGVAQRASDIDVVWLNGYGWPARTGGPMFWAEGVGLGRIATRLQFHADNLGSDAALSSRLAHIAASGGHAN